MPAYDFRCAACGTFEVHRSLAEVGVPAACPACASPARRVYTAPGFSVGPGVLRDASASTRRVVDRARSGEPVVTAAPSGRRLPPARHVH